MIVSQNSSPEIRKREQQPGSKSTEPRWQVVDRALRSIAMRRAALDAEEAQWLREAEALQIWRQLGMVSAVDYLERVLGYAPRTALERLRVARALGALPELTAALADGNLSHSAVRELTRVATPTTEAAWLAAATGKNLRQIEELVADHRPGDNPDDPPDPEARMHVVRFELAAETYALLRQTRVALDDEHSTNLPDDAFVTALCSAVLDGRPTSEPTGRAKFQIAVTVCERCGQGWQEGAGVQIPIDAAAVERAMCDAQRIGSLDGPAPERACQDIPPSVVRFVWRRDGGRCRVPGCRSARGLEVHHIIHRADGGSHDPVNLAILCGSCHLAHHRGALSISGTADQLEVHRPGHAARTPSRGGTATTSIETATATMSPSTTAHVVNQVASVAEVNPAVDAAGDTDAVAPGRAHVGVINPADLIASAARSETSNASPSVASARAHVSVINPPNTITDAERPEASNAGPSAASKRAHLGASNTAASTVGSEADVRPAGNRTPTVPPRAHVGASNNAASTAGPEPDVRPVDERTATAAPRAHVGVASRLDAAILRTQAKAALVGLGWKPAIAHEAVAAAVAAEGACLTLERLIFESLRRCPKPRA